MIAPKIVPQITESKGGASCSGNEIEILAPATTLHPIIPEFSFRCDINHSKSELYCTIKCKVS